MHTKALANICGLTGNVLRGLDTQCAQSIVKTAAHEKTQLMRMLMCTIIFWSMAICSSTMQHAIVEEDSHSIYNLQSSPSLALPFFQMTLEAVQHNLVAKTANNSDLFDVWESFVCYCSPQMIGKWPPIIMFPYVRDLYSFAEFQNP